MKDRLSVMGRLALYWMGFFTIARLIFVLYHWHQLSLLTFLDIATLFALGTRMDLAMTGYWLALPCLLMSIPWIKGRIPFYSQNVITITLLMASIIIIITDLELYSHWGFRMNTTPLFYISWEAAGSINPGSAVFLFILFIVMSAGSIVVYLRWISKRILNLSPLRLAKTPVMILITAGLIIPIRSSFSVAPMNSGVVYFHKTMAFPNHAGYNVTWNFLNSLVGQDEATYPTDFYSPSDREQKLYDLVGTKETPKHLFKEGKPNVILIIMESFTANIVESLGGMKGITPNLNQLISEGILFDNFYASGDRTDKGLASILSGYPAQPLTSIIKFPEKTAQLPYLSRAMQKIGYHTSFVYGGDIGFANMESYLTTAGFSHITDDDSFDGQPTTKWGVADHVVFGDLKEECDTAASPFFKVMLSLSSHEPFDVPMKTVIPGSEERSMYLNACYYADQSLGEFISQAKKQSWWDHTIVLITADHGHHFPNNSNEINDKDRFHIPLLFLGGALAKRDTVIHTIGGQTDIANTILGQLDHTRSDFRFSKDLLAPDVNSFAIFVFHNGYGMVDTKGQTVYDFDMKGYLSDGGDPNNKDRGKAYMQTLFSDYSKE